MKQFLVSIPGQSNNVNQFTYCTLRAAYATVWQREFLFNFENSHILETLCTARDYKNNTV